MCEIVEFDSTNIAEFCNHYRILQHCGILTFPGLSKMIVLFKFRGLCITWLIHEKICFHNKQVWGILKFKSFKLKNSCYRSTRQMAVWNDL